MQLRVKKMLAAGAGSAEETKALFETPAQGLLICLGVPPRPRQQQPG